MIFEIRNDMTNIPSNFGGEYKCLCGEKETMEHLYNCEHLSETKEKNIPFKEMYNGQLFIENLKRTQNKEMKE